MLSIPFPKNAFEITQQIPIFFVDFEAETFRPRAAGNGHAASHLWERLNRWIAIPPVLKTGCSGEIPFTYGPLAYLLKNRIYLGEIGHKGKWFPGEHAPIIDCETFERVQRILETNSEGRRGPRAKNGALLTGLLFDDRGNRMSPTFSTKQGARYRYYVSSPLVRGRKEAAGSVARVSAIDLEHAVLQELHKQRNSDDASPQQTIARCVERVALAKNSITVFLKSGGNAIEIPAHFAEKDLSEIQETSSSRRSDLMLVEALVRAQSWIRQLADGTYASVDDLAEAAHLHPKVIRNRLRLAFLSPHLTSSVLGGNHPGSLTIRKLVGSPALSWRIQEAEILS